MKRERRESAMKSTKITQVTSLFVAAFLLAAVNIIVVPDTAFAAPKSDPCKGKKGDRPAECGGGSGGDPMQFVVTVTTDTHQSNPFNPDSHPLDPDLNHCLLHTQPDTKTYFAHMPRHLHDPSGTGSFPECFLSYGGELTNPDTALTDDIILELITRKGKFVSFAISGQDTIGEGGIMHKSDVWGLNVDIPTDEERANGFDIPIGAYNLPIWKLKGHLGGKRVEAVGTVSVGTLHFAPCSPDCPTTWPVESPLDLQ